ncbi:MAG: hypothetical protein M1818_000580 [Claussenomyces sp. TS43310]|nr:MAG: hypothetical protein M1818_000580 [Claussenomyces sp. TS43310]
MDNPLSQPALVRRETLNRLEIGSGDKYSEWYQAPNTNLKVPGSTCTQVRDIHFSKLGRKEKEDALRTCDPQGLQACLTRLHELYLAKGSKKDKTDHLGLVLQGFVNFADVFTSVMTSILGAAPPEYQAAFSVVTFIYKGVKEKGDREEKLSGYLQSVIPMISQKQFYHDNIQTPRMRDAFLSFCTAIIKFVIAADKFCSRLAIGEN